MSSHTQRALNRRIKLISKKEVEIRLDNYLYEVLADLHHSFICSQNERAPTLDKELTGLTDQIVLVASEVAKRRRRFSTWLDVACEHIEVLLKREDISFSVMPFGMFFRDDLDLYMLEENARQSIITNGIEQGSIAAGIVIGRVMCASYLELGRQVSATYVQETQHSAAV